jgi:hypothetical protein
MLIFQPAPDNKASRRHIEAERFRCLQIDHKLELCGLHRRQIGWLGALEDAIDVTGGAPVMVDPIRPIGNQPLCVLKTSSV